MGSSSTGRTGSGGRSWRGRARGGAGRRGGGRPTRARGRATRGAGGRGAAGRVTTDGGAVARRLDAVLRLPGLDVARIRERRFHVALDAVRGAGGPGLRPPLEGPACRG